MKRKNNHRYRNNATTLRSRRGRVLVNLPLFLNRPAHALSVVLLLLFTLSLGQAANSEFRNRFIYNYKNFNFKAQEELIKENKAVMPDEIKALIKDAMADPVTLPQRMYLLDAASAMASGYKHYHGGGRKLGKYIDKLIKQELEKEEARVAELMKWKDEERFLGNFVMTAHEKEMEEAGLAPVIYPHWVHRIWFECKVCHQGIFAMKRWRNEISQKEIEAGRQCGVCHDGKMAFSAGDRESCERCHLAGKPEGARLHKAQLVDHEKIKGVADELGARWRADKLPGGRIPVDKYGFIDWLRLKELGVFNPIHSLDEEERHEIRDNRIFFKSKSKAKDVLFDHKIHSSWIKCSSCHPEVFSEDLNNDVKMVQMSKGKFCGHCHGKVSFTFADCTRCHSREKDAPLEGALLHLGSRTKMAKRRR